MRANDEDDGGEAVGTGLILSEVEPSLDTLFRLRPAELPGFSPGEVELAKMELANVVHPISGLFIIYSFTDHGGGDTEMRGDVVDGHAVEDVESPCRSTMRKPVGVRM